MNTGPLRNTFNSSVRRLKFYVDDVGASRGELVVELHGRTLGSDGRKEVSSPTANDRQRPAGEGDRAGPGSLQVSHLVN